jgi:hypothetical protein
MQLQESKIVLFCTANAVQRMLGCTAVHAWLCQHPASDAVTRKFPICFAQEHPPTFLVSVHSSEWCSLLITGSSTHTHQRSDPPCSRSCAGHSTAGMGQQRHQSA